MLYITFFACPRFSRLWLFSSPSLFIFLFQSKKYATSSSVDEKPKEDDKVYCKDWCLLSICYLIKKLWFTYWIIKSTSLEEQMLYFGQCLLSFKLATGVKMKYLYVVILKALTFMFTCLQPLNGPVFVHVVDYTFSWFCVLWNVLCKTRVAGFENADQ